tara:strand:- start:964 stop:1971 length:1008 start_codon:yes stop_codon:yes gene_type:complete
MFSRPINTIENIEENIEGNTEENTRHLRSYILNHSNNICEAIQNMNNEAHSNDTSDSIMQPRTVPTEEVLEVYAEFFFSNLMEEQEIPRNVSEYGSLNKVLHNCLMKLIPETEYLLSIGNKPETIMRWLADYKYYMNIVLQSVYSNVLKQEKTLNNYLLWQQRTNSFDMERHQELPQNVQEHIYSYLPYSVRAQVYLTLENSQKQFLMQMKVPEIRHFLEQVYRYFIVLGRIRNTEPEIRKTYYRIGFTMYSGMRKMDMLEMIYAFIKRSIFVKTKCCNTRAHFHQLAYNLCQVMILKMKNLTQKETRISQQLYIRRQIFTLETKLKRRLHRMLN